MRTRFVSLLILLGAASGVFYAKETSVASSDTEQAFIFRQVEYFHRWSKDDQHEFTPEGQENLNKWSDMMTVNTYPKVRDGDALAEAANTVLENYKNHEAKVLGTRSVPRTSDRPAEHFIAAVFTQPNFIEVAFARFKLVDGRGYSFVYSHRFYGERMSEEASAWLSANGEEVEKALLAWSFVPSPSLLR